MDALRAHPTKICGRDKFVQNIFVFFLVCYQHQRVRKFPTIPVPEVIKQLNSRVNIPNHERDTAKMPSSNLPSGQQGCSHPGFLKGTLRSQFSPTAHTLGIFSIQATGKVVAEIQAVKFALFLLIEVVPGLLSRHILKKVGISRLWPFSFWRERGIYFQFEYMPFPLAIDRCA